MLNIYKKEEFINKLKKAKLLVVGDVMLDRYWLGDSNRISPEAPVPVVKINNTQDRLGGAGNVALNAVNLGCKVKLLSVVGNDDPGLRIRALLEQASIETLLESDSNIASIVKLRILARNQQVLRCDFEERPSEEILLQHIKLFEKELSNTDIVIFSDYGKGGLEHIEKMISLAYKNDIPVLVDPKGSCYDKYRNSTFITPNLNEIKQVIGNWNSEDELQLLSQKLRKSLNIKNILLTRSEAGMTLFNEKGSSKIKAEAKEVFDVSGAGDTVIGVLSAMLAIGIDIMTAISISNKAAGIVIGKLGTVPISLNELLEIVYGQNKDSSEVK